MKHPDSFGLKPAWAPAKVNLYLHVGPPNSQGYHPLDSFVMFADVRAADRVSARLFAQLTLTMEGNGARTLRTEPNNLVRAAAMALRDAAGRPNLGAEITLYKDLPIAGGVGGGSADAAATLRLLNQLWDINFGQSALEAIGAQLGSDVPACIRNRPLIMRGVGERLTDAIAPSLHGVLVNPGIPLETRQVFERFDRRGSPQPFFERPAPATLDPVDFISMIRQHRNDLDSAARELCPEIGKVIQSIEEQPGCRLARMSGSGPTCFGIFETEAAAERAADAIADKKRRYWVRAMQFVGV